MMPILFGKGCVSAMYKIAVIGDADSVTIFNALGVDVCPTETAGQAKHALRRLIKENYAVICLTEQLAVCMDDELERCRERLTPAVILIPGRQGSLGLGASYAQKSVERAVGSRIL